MITSAVPSYLYTTVRQLNGGIEKYGFEIPTFSQDFLSNELKKPNSQFKNHLYNSLVNAKLMDEIQQYSWLMQQHKEKIAHARQEAAEEEDEDYEREMLSAESALPEKFEIEKASDPELARLREQQTQLSEQYDKLAKDLYEQLNKQAAETEKFHEKMDKSFHEQADKAKTAMTESLAELKIQEARATTTEEKERIQAKIKPLEEIEEDFKASIERESFAMKRLLLDIKNSQDPVMITQMIHKHINIQELKLKMLEDQLQKLEMTELTHKVRALTDSYGTDYTERHAELKEQVEQTKEVLQKMKVKEAEITSVNEKINDRENVLSGQTYPAQTSLPTKPTEIPRDEPSQGPTL